MKRPYISKIVLLLCLASSSAFASFNGKQITATWEIWSGQTPAAGGTVLGVLDKELITASDDTNPDFTGFHSSTGNDFELWDIDFNDNKIILTYSSINAGNFDNQYMYMSAVGMHFEDTENQLGNITSVTVEYKNAPFGFNPLLVRFDDNNIWIDLQGSMCHTTAMGSMPTCTNPESPTGYDNFITLIVEYEGMDQGTSANIDHERVNNLMDWAEETYPDYFPSSQSSFDLMGYYVRYYPESDLYLGTDGTNLYVYGTLFNGLYNAGNLGTWLTNLGF